MNTRIMIVLFLVLSTNSFCQKNYKNFNKFFGVQINVGITFYELDQLKSDFSQSITYFKQKHNIPLPIQHLYPNNINWSGYLFWYFSPSISILLGTEYTSTAAYSKYEDFYGTIDIKSEIEQYFINLGMRVHINNIEFVQPFFGFNVGLTRLDIENSNNISINNGQLFDQQSTKFIDEGYAIELITGINYGLDFALLEFAVTYRISELEVLQIEANNFNIKMGIKFGILK